MAPLHHANTSSEDDGDPQTRLRQTRIGLFLFWIYAIFYGIFIVANTFAASWMEWSPFLGLNMAVVSGMGLILFAVFLAIVYGYLCRTRSQP